MLINFDKFGNIIIMVTEHKQLELKSYKHLPNFICTFKCLYLATIIITKDKKFNSLKFSSITYTNKNSFIILIVYDMDNSISIFLCNFSLNCTHQLD